MRLLDLFCGAGGAAVGYHRAGFDVVGVDIAPQPHYPFEFHQADAMTFPLDGYDAVHVVGGQDAPLIGRRDTKSSREISEIFELQRAAFGQFDAIHASPPCQQFSQMSKCRPGLAATYPDLINPTRQRLRSAGIPYVIENVVGAPLVNPIMICGTGLGMTLQRHRLFESNVVMWSVGCHHGRNRWNPDYGHATGRKRRRVPVIGEWRIRKELQDEAMGIDWMTLPELSEAIPPAYTEHIGRQLLEHLQAAA
jgi:DNA (cytosine-5)-methyltransferase 1